MGHETKYVSTVDTAEPILEVTLTAEQNKRYGQLFEIAKNDGTRKSDRAADREAWTGLQEEWPALREFHGAKRD